ncbi:MAG: NUDIX domain-containing protein [Chitinivibrionales bacterium]|nr:NUDIX domain-containing protein [Chitinivibrionales bacterium]
MPKATVGAIIVQDNDGVNKVLLTKRNVPPFKGQWCLPGGHIEDYETSTNAVIREVKEETGLEFIPSFYGYFDEIYPDMEIHNVALIFEGPARGDLKLQPEEVSEAKWYTLDEAKKFDLAFSHNEVLERYA